jgi:YtkA-like protein
MKLHLAAILTVVLFSCSKANTELKLVQQQQSGDYKIAILSETGTIQQGNKPFTLEFRKAADDQLVDVGTVVVAPVMEMAGMAPMMAPAQVTPSGTPGKYTTVGNLTMSGHWKVNITFANGQNARFNLSAE